METLVVDNIRSALETGAFLTPVPELQECCDCY